MKQEYNNVKFIKVMFGENSSVNNELKYQLDKVNISKIWDPTNSDPRKMGGFNFSVPEKIIRWLHKGDTLYDVILPDDAEVIDVIESATPHGVFRSNKIIVTNPRKVTDEMAMEFYRLSTIPEIAYYKAMAGTAVMNYDKTAKQILKDKVNENNIDIVLKEWDDFIGNDKHNRINSNSTVRDIDEILQDVKNKH